MVNELKPCPLCGGEAGLWKAHPENPKRPAWVACMARCCVLVTREYECTEEAITAWNTRADTGRLSELEAEVARLRSALQFYADEANWIDTPSWDGDPECITPKAIPVNREEDGSSPCDCGDRARAALEASHAP